MEPPRHEVQLRRRLPDTAGLPNVPPKERKRTPREELVQKLRPTHVLATRLRPTQPSSALPNRTNAEPNVGGQRRSQREDAGVAQSAARALERRG